MDDPVPTYSVSFRLQRTTTEFAFVSVPVSADLIVEQPDATGRIDVAKMVQRAVELGQAAGVVWQPERQEVRPHPIQTRPPALALGEQGAEPGTETDGGVRFGFWMFVAQRAPSLLTWVVRLRRRTDGR